MSEPLFVEIRDGETMDAALLRELRAVTATLRQLHNRMIGDDETPGGEQLRREVLVAVEHAVAEWGEQHMLLIDVLEKIRPPSILGWNGLLVDAVRVELARIVDVRRTPIALLATTGKEGESNG